jgi:prevent-host-death family protein
MSSEQARTKWRNLLDLASRGGVDVVIERHGKATAAVISYEEYVAIRSALSRLRAGAPARRRGQQMATILDRLAQMPERQHISDPVAWQQKQREERPLAGRDN